MAKHGYGVEFIAVPHLGIHTREDLDKCCHYEVREKLNTFLWLQSEYDVGPGALLQLVAVNPDGERRGMEHYFHCYWHSVAAAREIIDHFNNARTGDSELCMDVRQWEKRRETFRAGALELWKKHRGQARETQLKAEEGYKQQEAYYRRLKERGC